MITSKNFMLNKQTLHGREETWILLTRSVAVTACYWWEKVICSSILSLFVVCITYVFAFCGAHKEILLSLFYIRIFLTSLYFFLFLQNGWFDFALLIIIKVGINWWTISEEESNKYLFLLISGKRPISKLLYTYNYCIVIKKWIMLKC